MYSRYERYWSAAQAAPYNIKFTSYHLSKSSKSLSFSSAISPSTALPLILEKTLYTSHDLSCYLMRAIFAEQSQIALQNISKDPHLISLSWIYSFNSIARRDFPTPASPIIETICPRPASVNGPGGIADEAEWYGSTTIR